MSREYYINEIKKSGYNYKFEYYKDSQIYCMFCNMLARGKLVTNGYKSTYQPRKENSYGKNRLYR